LLVIERDQPRAHTQKLVGHAHLFRVTHQFSTKLWKLRCYSRSIL